MDSFKKNYRIIVEPISEEAQDLPDDFKSGIECSGFTLLADLGDRTMRCIQSVSVLDIAQAIFKESALMQAAHIAKAMREANDMRSAYMFSNFIDRVTNDKSEK